MVIHIPLPVAVCPNESWAFRWIPRSAYPKVTMIFSHGFFRRSHSLNRRSARSRRRSQRL